MLEPDLEAELAAREDLLRRRIRLDVKREEYRRRLDAQLAELAAEGVTEEGLDEAVRQADDELAAALVAYRREVAEQERLLDEAERIERELEGM